jgi:recombination protein RecR|uniref:Recombination protein RecR n=1 Tax=candidate division WOR-3 bacterium TaxID=2052148 RepID=A0A7C6EFE3_UNCW3
MLRTLDRLIAELVKLPGIGNKTAQRITFYLLKTDSEFAEGLAQAILAAKRNLHFCSVCFNLTETEKCEICSDPSRDRSLLCVVEDVSDIMTIERSRQFSGLYHVLGGVLSPLDHIGPDELKIKELLARLNREPIAEVIIATNPTTEGEATAFYLAKIIKPLGIKVTRIARGLPIGSDLDLADDVTVSKAIEGRKEI